MATLTERYTQFIAAYRERLGFTFERGGAPTYQVVLLPTFHLPCGICFHDDATEPLISVHVLLREGRLEDIALCTPAEFERLHQLAASLAPNTVAEDEARSRDGIVISVMWQGAQCVQSAFFTSATLAADQVHRDFVDGFIAALHAHLGGLPTPFLPGGSLGSYLAAIQQYWKRATRPFAADTQRPAR